MKYFDALQPGFSFPLREGAILADRKATYSLVCHLGILSLTL